MWNSTIWIITFDNFSKSCKSDRSRTSMHKELTDWTKESRSIWTRAGSSKISHNIYEIKLFAAFNKNKPFRLQDGLTQEVKLFLRLSKRTQDS